MANILRAMIPAVRPLTLRELAVAADLPEEHRHNLPVLERIIREILCLISFTVSQAILNHINEFSGCEYAVDCCKEKPAEIFCLVVT